MEEDWSGAKPRHWQGGKKTFLNTVSPSSPTERRPCRRLFAPAA